jgi:hypothetical protein
VQVNPSPGYSDESRVSVAQRVSPSVPPKKKFALTVKTPSSMSTSVSCCVAKVRPSACIVFPTKV